MSAQRRRVFDFNIKRDDFTEIWQKINTHTAHFDDKVLVIHASNRGGLPEITWQRNVSDLKNTSRLGKDNLQFGR